MTVPRTICLGFILVILTGTFLLMMPFSTQAAGWDSFITALFTSTSAVCVTGLSVVDVGQHYTFWGQLVLLLLVEIGALGYMSATTILLMLIGRKFGIKEKVALQQTLDTSGLGGVVGLLRHIVVTMAVFQLTGIILLLWVFRPDYGLQQGLWLAIFHSINGFNNAGFSLFSNSLMGYVTSPLLNLTMSILIIFGGLGYQVIIEMLLWLKNQFSRQKSRREFSLHFKVVTRTTLFLLIAGTVLIFITEFQNEQTLGNLAFPQQLMAAWFQSVTSRTAGFNSINTGGLVPASLFITAILMFIGASPGSTGGGVKTTTCRVLLNCTFSALQGRDEVLCHQRKIPNYIILKAVGVLVGSVFVISVATLLTVAMQPELGFVAIFFEIISAFATVGLSTGITADFSPLNQLIIVVTMYIGRVGILLLISAFFEETKPSSVDYPEANLLVG
ncbi:MAG: TrkH family potassium uptake protein [Microcoleaceae cyanobacterium]